MQKFGDRKFLAAGLLVILTGLLYLPALSSGFQLDDLSNLGRLGSVEKTGILHFILGGTSGPTGRPLSLLTFALQHEAWPDNSTAFKTVNLLIHLACGWLIFLISHRISVLLKLNSRDGGFFSLAVTALWLLHPMHLTTVLYVVQRMTQLSALFTLLGIFFYLVLRERHAAKSDLRYLVLMGIAVWGCTGLAVLCKENGILLPLFILVLNQTLLLDTGRRPLAITNWIVLGLPLLAIAVYLALGIDNVQAGFRLRDFTMVERLMTEAVILVDYLHHLVMPYPGAFSLFHDDFPVSRGLLQPPGTLVSILVILALLIAAVMIRKRFPLAGFGLLWFFAGHALESTYLPLELYFEHRNYLPSLGVCVLLVYLALAVGRKFHNPRLAYGLLAVYGIWIVANTVLEINLWTRPVERYQQQVEKHPGSTRAVAALGNLYISRLQIRAAQDLYRQLAESNPDDIYPQLKLLALRGCVTHEEISDAEWQQLVNQAKDADWSRYGLIEELVLIAAVIRENECRSMNPYHVVRLLVTMAHNPSFQRRRGILFEMAARMGIYIGDRGVAYHNIKAAVKSSPTIKREMLELRILIALEKTQEARETLNRLQQKVKKDIRDRILYADTLAELEQQIAGAR